MKNKYLLSAALAISICGNVNAQTLSEDFESWAAGSYMGTNSASWTTWSGTTGGTEDVQVSTAQASNGTKSIYFSSISANGGPQDVIVPFGGAHNKGQFNFASNFFVETGKGAYFNFQANTTVGQIWSFNCQMTDNGEITFDDGNSLWLTTTYPMNSWFNLEIDVDLNTNSWDILIDGSSVGVFQAVTGQIASIDIFPVNSANGGSNISGFYMDEFEYTYTPFTLPAVNAAVSYVDGLSGLATDLVNPTAKVRNLGTTTITSFDIELDYNGIQINENITGVSIGSNGTYDVAFTSPITLVGGLNAVTVTVSNVNGAGADGNAADDVKVIMINKVVPAVGKMVVGEEGTGTWCQWCPRGAVFMDFMEDTYGDYWAGIAVHNGDPMTYDPYDTGIGALINGYPSAIVDRGNDIDPSGLEGQFLNRITVAPSASIVNGAIYDAASGQLNISVTANFLTTVTGNWKLACVITEDGVTGSGAGWSQSNAYSGGNSGIMGGYETLGNPVPASQMVYDHVARVILPNFYGLPNSFPSTLSGETHTVNFSLNVDPTWDLANIHIIGMLINPSGDIDNAGKATLAEAQTNGYIESTVSVIGLEEDNLAGPTFNIYPNPATDQAFISLGNLDNEEVTISVLDLNGRIVAFRNYGVMSGAAKFPVNTSDFAKGMYTIKITTGDSQRTEKLIVE